MSIAEKLLSFRKKSKEEIVDSLVIRLCSLYCFLPETDQESYISWGEGKFWLPKDVSSLLGFDKQEERNATVFVQIEGEESHMKAVVSIESEDRRIEICLDGRQEIHLTTNASEAREEPGSIVAPLVLLEQAIEMGERIVALRQTAPGC